MGRISAFSWQTASECVSDLAIPNRIGAGIGCSFLRRVVNRLRLPILASLLLVGVSGQRALAQVTYSFNGTTDVGLAGLAQTFSFTSSSFIVSDTSVPVVSLTTCFGANNGGNGCLGGVDFFPNDSFRAGAPYDVLIFGTQANANAYYFPVGAFSHPGTYGNAIPGFPQTGTLIVSGTAPSIQITTSTLPSGLVGQIYSSGQLAATGGSGAYVWSLVGGALPLGYSVIGTTILGGPPGPPATAGKYPFRLRVTDLNDSSLFADMDFMLVILTPVTILDPVCATPCSLLSGPQITGVRTQLAVGGRAVLGVAADGIAQLVFRVPALSAADEVSVTLLSDQCSDPSTPSTCAASASSDDDGGLFAVGAPVTSAQSLPNSWSDTADGTTQNAFIAYRAPIDFARMATPTDALRASRSIYVRLTYSSGGTPYGSQIIPLMIVRAPLVLVHGFKDNKLTWNTFTPLIAATSKYSIFRVDYGMPLYEPDLSPCNNPPCRLVRPTTPIDIQSTIPPIDLDTVYTEARQSHLGFTFLDTSMVAEQVESFLDSFSLGNNPSQMPVAVVRADLVAHSMGGLVARYWATLPSVYLVDRNYRSGTIHKLITLGTPHLGSPLAILSVLPQSDCSRNLLAAGGALFFSSAATKSSPVPGAAAELSGDGVGAYLSPALQAIQSHGALVPTEALAGDIESIKSNIDSFSILSTLFTLCKPTDPIASRLKASAFDSMFDPQIRPTNPGGASGRENDGIVPLTSALNDPKVATLSLCGHSQCFSGYAHSSGIAGFFGGSTVNHLLDGSQQVSTRVEELLNTSIKTPLLWGN